MTPTLERAEIELDDAGQTSWWAGILTTLVSPYGSAQMRLVARPPGRQPYTSGTFPVPRTWGTVDPAEPWAPGMRACLEEISQEMERDGWRRTGSGAHAWSFVFERPASTESSPAPVSDRTRGDGAPRPAGEG